jgi:hypothetical protein
MRDIRWPVLLGTLLISACDAEIGVHFRVSAVGEDSTAQQSARIAAALAARHSLRAHTRSECDVARYEHSRDTRLLVLCVEQEPQSVSFELEEFIWGGAWSPKWSAKGDSVRRELEDTLRARFGDRVTKSEL